MENEEICPQCGEQKEINETHCFVCLIQKKGLPWMSEMVINKKHEGDVHHITIKDNDFLLVTIDDGCLLFTKEDCIKAEERFRGERELTR